METEESNKSVTPPPVPVEQAVESAGCKACGAEPEPGFPLVSRITRLLVMPIVGVIYLATIGRFFWLDLFYGIGVAVGLPTLAVAIYSAFV